MHIKTRTASLSPASLLLAGLVLALSLVMVVAMTIPSGATEPTAAARGGIKGRLAPALEVTNWTNLPPGQSSIDVTDHRGDVVVLFFFQSWCPGCHSRGFPTINSLIEQYGTDGDVRFMTVQTVFEGEDVNTPERGRESLARHGLTIPLGHDVRGENRRASVMGRYRTRGTPWIVIIDRFGIVRFNAFHISGSDAKRLIDTLRATPVGPPQR